MQFAGDVDAVIKRIGAGVDADLDRRLRVAPGQAQPEHLDASSPLPLLRAAREAAQKAVGVDEARTKRFKEIKAQLAAWTSEQAALKKRIEHIAGADERRKNHGQERRAAYVGVFDTFVECQRILQELYKPLLSRLKSVKSAAKMGFGVVRRVDVDAWVALGEQLLDLRTAGEFRGRGALKRAAEQELLPAWRTGGAAEVAAAMSAFVENHRDDIAAGRSSAATPEAVREWSNRISRWLFATDHVMLHYGLRYDGQEIERLSPGTRGIVLLTLYLAIDEWDRRPLLVDQPEENLDPKSVFEELVGFFRDARTRRQVILVTHNANLVVNTDADQVIIASSTRKQANGLPDISYVAGALENRAIRDAVCELLEGGEKAFRERERRYRLRSAKGEED
jgi:hypothetical protein